MKYAAFLRGINVSGQKLIKMEELSSIFESAGFKNVKTYLASGNVVFDAAQKSETAVSKKLKTTLHSALGYEVDVMLRTLDELHALVALDPFQKVKSKGAKRYLTFLAEPPVKVPKLPLISAKKNVEVIRIIDRDAFSLVTTIPNGDYPNPFLEKLLKISATTRNWNTIEKIINLSC